MDQEENLKILVIDTGIGLLASKERRHTGVHTHRSRSTELLRERVQLLKKFGQNIEVVTRDGPKGGVVVSISTNTYE
jgi:hypothetical protein